MLFRFHPDLTYFWPRLPDRWRAPGLLGFALSEATGLSRRTAAFLILFVTRRGALPTS